jgi:hypothetical protein
MAFNAELGVSNFTRGSGIDADDGGETAAGSSIDEKPDAKEQAEKLIRLLRSQMFNVSRFLTHTSRCYDWKDK